MSGDSFAYLCTYTGILYYSTLVGTLLIFKKKEIILLHIGDIFLSKYLFLGEH